MMVEKKTVRRLALSKETLRQLTSKDLKRAAGGGSWLYACTVAVRKPQPTNQ